MAAPLRLLLVEDSEDDAELVALALRRAGLSIAPERVETGKAMQAALDRGPWDAVIADYVMPAFGGLDALAVVRERGLDVPFFLVSGALPDETAIAAMKNGCHDYVTKQNLARLAPAVVRELHEAELRRERRQALDALHFLVEASVVLGASFDFTSIVQRALALAVPRLADWATFDLVEDDGRARRLAAVHADPDKAQLLRELWARYPTPPEHTRRGRARIMADIDDATLREGSFDAGHMALLRALGMRDAIVVPIVLHDRTIGSVTFVSGDSGRRYGPADQAIVEEFALRCALALENNRLYREAQAAARCAEESLTRERQARAAAELTALDNAILYGQAQEAIRVRDDFLQVASHELRTPLTSLKLQVQMLLRRGASTELSPASLTRINGELIARQVDRLTLLVDGLLDVSRLMVERFRLDLEEVDLAAVTRDVSARFAHEMSRASSPLVVRAREPVVGRWDRNRLEQIVSNLLSNAGKFGAGKPIEVEVDADDGAARLRVRDHGIGIDPCDVDRIFGRFERAVSVRHYGGLGLGLYLAHQIVKALGGSIRVESAPGEGSTFIVELPRAPAERAERAM